MVLPAQNLHQVGISLAVWPIQNAPRPQDGGKNEQQVVALILQRDEDQLRTCPSGSPASERVKQLGYPPKSSYAIFSGSTPRSSSILNTAWFIIGGPQM